MHEARRRIQRMQDSVPIRADPALPAMRKEVRRPARVEPAPPRAVRCPLNTPVAPGGANNTPRRSDPVAAPKRDGEGGGRKLGLLRFVRRADRDRRANPAIVSGRSMDQAILETDHMQAPLDTGVPFIHVP